MAIYQYTAPDGNKYRVNAPEGATDQQVYGLVLQNYPFAGQSTKELEEAKSAPSTLGDVGRTAKQSLAGGLQSLTNLFGADNAASQYLGEAQQSAFEGMSPARKEEMARRQELQERAQKGSALDQAKAGVGGFFDAPLQTGLGALVSSAPIIAAGLLPGGQLAAGASLGARALAGARGVGGVGGLMGLGGQKGQDYATVKQELLNQGVDPATAEQKAQEAAAYSLQNAPRQGAALGAGILEGVFGVERILANAAKKVSTSQGASSLTPLEFKQKLGAVAGSAFGEALPEAIQATVGQVGTNIALNQAGVSKDLTEGLAGTVAHDALVGSVLGLAVSPLQVSNLQRQYKQALVDDQAKKQVEADAKVQAETQKAEAERAVLQKQTDEIQKQMEQQQAIALPAPSEEIPVEEVQTDPLKNPLGNIRKSEVPFDIYKQIDDYRKQAGLPKLKEYSIEDFVDAMPGQNPKAEQGLLDQLITAKSGYAGEKYTAQDILNQAKLKNVETNTKGFQDFLARTTGVNALEKMSQPQLHAAFKALASLPAATTSTILPEGTNASRYDEKQYDKAIKGVDFLLAELGVPVDPKEVIKTIKEYTNLTEDSHAGAILDAAIKNGDVDLIKTPRYEIYDPKTGAVMPSTYTSRTAARAAAAKRGLNVRQITTDAIAAPTTSATLPEGFDIREGAFKEGEAPAGYELYAGDTLLSKSDTIDEANAKKASSEKTRAGMALRLENQIKQLNNSIEAGQKRLDSSEARGEGQSTNFQKAAGRQAKLVAETQAKIASLTEQIQKLDPKVTPVEVKPTANKAISRKGYTVFEQAQARATYPSRQAAEESILSEMSNKQLQELAQQQGRRAVGKKAQAELERRTPKAPTAAEAKRFAEQKPVSEVLEGIKTEAKAEKAKAEAAKETPEVKEKLAKLEAELKPLLKQFGLGNIKLNFVEKLVEGNGSYNESLIKIALSAKEPVRVLRHESLHALKDLGFFTPEQWSALERMAKDQWIDKYLKSQKSEYKGKPTFRYDAYVDYYKGDMSKVTEEAIADAFADFANNKPPAGMLAALLKRLNDFFTALRNALNSAGFQTAEDVFGQIERGELKAGTATQGDKRLSVLPGKAPEIDPNDVGNVVKTSPYKDAGINVLNSQIAKTSKALEIDGVGKLFDEAYLAEFKKRGDWRNPNDFNRAVAQAVEELKFQLRQSKSGLDWYEEDIAEAFKLTQRYIPSLKKPEKRALFSVIAGIMSPSTNARDNWVIATQAYQSYEKTGVLPGTNPATGGLWMGGLESANKKKQLDMLNAMLQPKSRGGLGEKAAVEWLQGSHTVAEITDFRAKYGGMGKSNVGGKATDILPGFTAFGPKVGPFVMNINGIHEVTVDVWMTRTFNRYFGQMMGADGKIIRAPTEPQRVAIKNLAVQAAQQLGIKPYQVQSVLWFLEQQIFNKLGTGAKSYGFSDGAIKFIETQGGVGGAKVSAPDSGVNAVTDGATGQQAGQVSPSAGRLPARTTKQGVSDDTGKQLSLREPTARSGTGGGERLSITGSEEGQSEPSRDRERRDQVRGFTPLAGAPNVSGATGPDPSLVKVAEDYAKKYKIPYRRQASYVEIDEDFASLVAQAYDVMPHAPQNPKVKEAYQDLNRQTRDQYDALVDAGYTFTFFDSNTDPYDGNPFNAMRDLRKNKQMAVYGTYDGYGTEGITGAAVEDNPMLEDTGLRWPDQNGVEHMVTANDLFRAVHDAFGHGLEGAGFRARGEENAWQAHARLFTGPAVGAITSETRGQNSWLNFGPYGEKNRTAKIEDTVFAEQKTGLMPDWTWNTNIVDDEGIVLGSKQADAVSVKGLHYGKARVEELDASKYGSGVRGAERRRLEQTDDDRIKQRVYFYIAKPDGSTPLPEAGVGQYVYTQKFDNVLGQGPTMSRLFREANGDSNAFESLVVDAGYDGYAVPNMGMMVILNHNTPVNYKGTRSELADDQKRLSLNEAAPNSLLTKRMSSIGIKSTDDFWRRIQNVMIGTGSRNPSLSAALDTTSTSDQVKQAIAVWKKDVDASGIQNYLQKFRIQGAVPEIDDLIAGPPTVKKMLLEAGIRPTLGNAISAYNSLPRSIADDAVNDMRYSLREAPDTPEFKQFFGDSKVVDANGKPLVVSHISKAEPTVFDKKYKTDLSSMGFHFGTREQAEFRGTQYDFESRSPTMGDYYLSIQNPLEVSHMASYAPDHLADQMMDMDLITEDKYASFRDKYRDEPDIGAALVKILQKAGYDGLVYSNEMEGEGNSYVPFEPTQIKSATDNTGAYSKYNPDVRYSLRDSTDPDTLARVNETTTTREEKGYVERITQALGGDTYSQLRAQSLNRYNRLSDVDKAVVKKRGGAALMADESAEAGALQSDLAAGVTASVLGVHDRNGGIPIYVNGVTKAFNDGGKIKGPVAIFAPLSKYNDPLIYQLYQFWAAAQRGSRLNEQGKPDIFTDDDLKRAEKLEQDHPEFRQIQEEWTVFNNGLMQYLVDTGVLSEGDRARFTEFSDYIPFYRQMEGEKTIGPNIFQSISGVKKPKKLSEGKDKAPLADFLETIVRNTQSSIQMGMKNVAAQRAIDRAMEIDMAERLRPNAPTGLDTVQVLEKGQVVTYQVADHLFIDAVKSLNMPELPFIGLLSGPANFLRNMVTKDPGFMLANMVRDSMAAYVTSGVKMTPLVDTMSNFGKAMAGTSPEFEALLNAGIGGGYEFSQNIEMSGRAFEKELNKKYEGKTLFQRILNPMTAPTSLWEALEKGTTASDMATRIEVYKRTLAETNNEAEALHRALEVMNFNRKGSSPVIRILTAAIPFLNARMQGLDVLYRASFGEMNNKDAAMIQKRFIVRGLTMTALSAMYWTLTHDDEEYKKQEQETKDNNWLVPSLGIKIPIPFEIGVIFKVIPERIMALTLGQDTNKDFMDSMIRNLRSTLAIDYLPQAIKPFVETETNFSLFTRRPIVGQGLEGVAPEFQIGPGTSSLAAFAGSNLGMSPMKIDHLIGGYTGTMGMYMVSALDGIMNMNAENPNASKRFEQLPFIKRFALDPEARGTVTGYYDLKNATDEVVRTSSLLERTMNFEERGRFMQENIKMLANKDYILDLEKTMKNFRQMQVMIRSSNMDADAKREALLRINQAQNALTANINTIRANVM